MDFLSFIANFLYRIRYKLTFGVIIASLLSFYLTNLLPKRFSVTTTIFTGITSKSTVDDMGGRTDWNAANNAHENIINIVKSKSTLQAVSIKLLAQHLMYGDPNNDNRYIMAKNYRNLQKLPTPPHILDLVDKKSFERTVENLNNYRKEGKGNFVYEVFNWDNKYYGYIDLSRIKVGRKGGSDMIEISYENEDPGITTNTIAFINEELVKRYESLLLSASNDVVRHFEEQLKLAKEKLDDSENKLIEFNIENKIINYEEQTKHLAALNNIMEDRYKEIQLAYGSSQALMKELEVQMETRVKLVRENELFIKSLSDISTLNGKIAEIEIFNSSNDSTPDNELLKRYKYELSQTERNIKEISSNMEHYKSTKEGIAIPEMVSQWLDALLKFEKSKAELLVMEESRKELGKQFDFYSPVGPNLTKQTRNVKVEEEAYLSILHHLGLAKLKQKNILLDAGTLQIVTPPETPFLVIPRKRALYMITAVVGTILFIIGYYLLLELLDRTLRDGPRTHRITSMKVVGAYPSNKRLKYRSFYEEDCHIATSVLANVINEYITPNKTLIVNLLSMNAGEGKTHIAEHLSQYWEDVGFKVVHLSHNAEEIVSNSKEFLQASCLWDLPSLPANAKEADILMVEYAPLNLSSIPKPLLQEGSVNLLIMDATRSWNDNDRTSLDRLKSGLSDKQDLLAYLNNADREAVEQYTGQLPPYTSLRKLVYRLKNFGFTATI